MAKSTGQQERQQTEQSRAEGSEQAGKKAAIESLSPKPQSLDFGLALPMVPFKIPSMLPLVHTTLSSRE